jgi:hypothetical protein
VETLLPLVVLVVVMVLLLLAVVEGCVFHAVLDRGSFTSVLILPLIMALNVGLLPAHDSL